MRSRDEGEIFEEFKEEKGARMEEGDEEMRSLK